MTVQDEYDEYRDIIDAEPSSYEEVAKKKGKESTSSRRMMSSIETWREVRSSIM